MVSRFEPELSAFDSSPAPLGANVFYGSSSIRLWDNLAQCFAGLPVVNRGFGGSTLAECVEFLPRVILPLRPGRLVLYAADNDLAEGGSPEHTLSLFEAFMQLIREEFATLPIAFISIKPSPARFWNIANIRRANELIEAAVVRHPGVDYLDVFPAMLSPAGGSRPDLFTEDGLHMNAAGYGLWTARIRAWIDSVEIAA